VWNQGLNGALNYYRASPLKPPLTPDDAVMKLTLTPEFVTVRQPTLVIWGEADTALPPGLLNGLEAFVPHMHLVRVPGASHWIVHEQPGWVADEIEQFLIVG
jgi:epoxide hydrolase 4